MYTINYKIVYVIYDGSLLEVGGSWKGQGEMNDANSSTFWRLALLHCSSCQAPHDLS